MKYEDLPLPWQRHFELKCPEGRACQKCGDQIPLVKCTFTKHPKQGFCLDRFCEPCRKEYARAKTSQRRSMFRKTRHFVKGSAGPAMEERRPLPRLEVGKRYAIGKDFSGPVIGTVGAHFVLETGTGPRLFTQAQLVGVPIREV